VDIAAPINGFPILSAEMPISLAPVFNHLLESTCLVVVRPAAFRRGQIGLHGVFLAGSVAFHFAALANTLVRLDVGAGRNFL